MEYVTDMPIVVEWLNSNTQYYFLISAFNEEWEESIFSEETSFATIGWVEPQSEMNASQDFKLAWIEVLAQNQVSLEFTSPLENTDGAQREFKVVEKDNELNIFYIKESKLDPENSAKILVIFEDILPVSTEFTLTVIDILDENGRNIESGIESFENFYLDESFLDVIVEDTSTIDVQWWEDTTTTVEWSENITEPQWTQNTSSTEWTEMTNENTWEQTVGIDPITWEPQWTEKTNENTWEQTVSIDPVTGEIMESSEIGIDLHSAWSDAKILPTTGPEHVLMFILALIFGAMLFVFKFRKA
jgi:hypothetical protein